MKNRLEVPFKSEVDLCFSNIKDCQTLDSLKDLHQMLQQKPQYTFKHTLIQYLEKLKRCKVNAQDVASITALLKSIKQQYDCYNVLYPSLQKIVTERNADIVRQEVFYETADRIGVHFSNNITDQQKLVETIVNMSQLKRESSALNIQKVVKPKFTSNSVKSSNNMSTKINNSHLKSNSVIHNSPKSVSVQTDKIDIAAFRRKHQNAVNKSATSDLLYTSNIQQKTAVLHFDEQKELQKQYNKLLLEMRPKTHIDPKRVKFKQQIIEMKQNELRKMLGSSPSSANISRMSRCNTGLSELNPFRNSEANLSPVLKSSKNKMASFCSYMVDVPISEQMQNKINTIFRFRTQKQIIFKKIVVCKMEELKMEDKGMIKKYAEICKHMQKTMINQVKQAHVLCQSITYKILQLKRNQSVVVKPAHYKYNKIMIKVQKCKIYIATLKQLKNKHKLQLKMINAKRQLLVTLCARQIDATPGRDTLDSSAGDSIPMLTVDDLDE
ncbi:Hypothetical_protein [Hexamita inflata]|uniref:Hypothetical_protein n=1 Tax=Hexamita inflata TaxID=28002 RepID=A0AA86QSL5_9EUKA|nr:Hypothetical protein HINF_LOCUS46448 [Hexamita inflata]